MLESTWCNRWRGAVQLGLAVGLAILSLGTALFLLGTYQVPSARAAPLSQGSGPVITMGVASGLTGPLPELGWQQANAVQLAVDQINAAGGITVGGTDYTVTLVAVDSACNASQAVAAANQLLAAQVVGVVGHMCSSASIAASPLYNAAGVAMVSPLSTAPLLTQQGYTTTFRTIPFDGSAVIKLAEYFYSLDFKRTAILLRSEPDLWSELLADIYQNRYTALGGVVTSRRTITETSDIAPALTAIQSENVDVILVTDWQGDKAGEVSQAAYNMGLAVPIGWLGLNDDYINTYAGAQAAEGDYGAVVGRRTSDMPGYAAFQSAYVAANFPNQPNNPGSAAPFAYDAANIIMDSIRRANTTDTIAVRDALAATTNFSGVVGVYQGFDAAGDVIPQWSRLEVVENGRWVPAQLEAEFYAGQGGTLDLANTWGQTTTIQIPGQAVTSTLLVTYSLFATTTQAGLPTQTMVSQHAIRLETNLSFSSPMTLTIQYNEADVAGINESTLRLYTWNGSQWVDAQPCGGYSRDLSNNILQAVLCHFSDYVLLGRSQRSVYLPVVVK